MAVRDSILHDEQHTDFSPDSPELNLTLRGRLTLQGQLLVSSVVPAFHATKAADLPN